MKRFTLSVVMTGVLGLAAFSLSSAQQPGRGPGGPRGFGPGGPGRGGAAMLRGVDLSEEQQASIKAIHEAGRAARESGGGNGGWQAEQALHAEIFADAPDAQKIAGLEQQVAQAHAAALAQRTSTMQKIAQVLTAEQRAAVRDRLARAPTERRGPPEGRGRPDDGPRERRH